MAAPEQPAPAPEERSAVAGGCVLVVLAGVPVAVAWALLPEAGVLAVWVVAVAAVWWSARRIGTDQPLPSPTEPPSPHGELPGQGPVDVVHREGMSIFLRDDPDQPARTHVRVEVHDETHA
jgi:hypothetical protein